MASLTARMLQTATTHHMWQPGDRIRDIRYVQLDDRDGPFVVQVGIHEPEQLRHHEDPTEIQVGRRILHRLGQSGAGVAALRPPRR